MEYHIEEIPFVVVDVETTGTNARENRVIEIACLVVQDGEVIEEFSSLVNPEQHIPAFIANMTGISNAMVYNAPNPEKVFAKVRSLVALPNAVFVAHNVNFDWSFVHSSFLRAGLPAIEIPRLCTYRLARRLLSGHQKFNLGALSTHFGISIRDRHRAGGDAAATAQVLLHFLEMLQEQYQLSSVDDLLAFQNKLLLNFKKMPKYIQHLQSMVDSLPHEPGVYYFQSRNEEVLYIGKAKSLRDRVGSYFQHGASHSQKIEELVRQVRNITWECTGTELSALLLESKEIKSYQPRYNTMIKRYRRYPFLRLGADDDFPRIEWCTEIEDDGAEYFGPFNNRSSVESLVDTINRTFRLRECSDALRPSQTITPCFYHQIQRCGAPCAELQTREEYSREVERVRDFLSGQKEGIIAVLRQAMQESAEKLDFEDAILLRNRMKELERVFFRQAQISTSVNTNNVLMVIPTAQSGNVEVFFVRYGRLAYQRIVSRRTPFKEFERIVEKIYFDGSLAPKYCSKEEIDEIRIIASWIHQHRAEGKFLYIAGLSKEEILKQLGDLITTVK